MVHCYFETGSLKSTFKSNLLVGGGREVTKSALCTPLIMLTTLTIMDDPYLILHIKGLCAIANLSTDIFRVVFPTLHFTH